MALNDLEVAARKALPQAASIWVEAARLKAKTKDIQEGFEIGQVEVNGTIFSITIRNKAPEAPAYEYGSGLHGREKAKYPIRPKDKNALAFEWNPAFTPYGSPKFIAISSRTGKYLFRYVEHPGVAAEPFMKPALEEKKEEMAKVIGHTFAVEFIHRSIREMWNSA